MRILSVFCFDQYIDNKNLFSVLVEDSEPAVMCNSKKMRGLKINILTLFFFKVCFLLLLLLVGGALWCMLGRNCTTCLLDARNHMIQKLI